MDGVRFKGRERRRWREELNLVVPQKALLRGIRSRQVSFLAKDHPDAEFNLNAFDESGSVHGGTKTHVLGGGFPEETSVERP